MHLDIALLHLRLPDGGERSPLAAGVKALTWSFDRHPDDGRWPARDSPPFAGAPLPGDTFAIRFLAHGYRLASRYRYGATGWQMVQAHSDRVGLYGD
jgi:hypothetical protein